MLVELLLDSHSPSSLSTLISQSPQPTKACCLQQPTISCHDDATHVVVYNMQRSATIRYVLLSLFCCCFVRRHLSARHHNDWSKTKTDIMSQSTDWEHVNSRMMLWTPNEDPLLRTPSESFAIMRTNHSYSFISDGRKGTVTNKNTYPNWKDILSCDGTTKL